MLSARSTIRSAGSTGATGSADGSAGSTGATGSADGSARSTGAADAGGEANLDGAATGLAVDSTVALPSVPRANRER